MGGETVFYFADPEGVMRRSFILLIFVDFGRVQRHLLFRRIGGIYKAIFYFYHPEGGDVKIFYCDDDEMIKNQTLSFITELHDARVP